MAETPSSPVALATDAIRDWISVSAEFQSWTETGDATAAKARVYVEEQYERVRPFVILHIGDLESVSNHGDTLEFELLFEAAVSAAHDGDDDQVNASYEFQNPVSTIVKELNESASANNLMLSLPLTLGEWMRSDNDNDSDDDFMQAFAKGTLGGTD